MLVLKAERSSRILPKLPVSACPFDVAMRGFEVVNASGN